jgi:succinyl-diaminopimelate desuccinylase
MKNITDILKDLIKIPSWVDNLTNERNIGEFIYSFLKGNTNLSIIKQLVINDRFNIIASKGNNVDMLVIGHIDTVQPTSNWIKNPIIPEVIGDKIFGMGSTDMKSGIAVMLNLAIQPALKNNTAFLFYCDEEYDFSGMKIFIEEYRNKIKPKLIISLDGEELQIRNSCRGLIELSVIAQGKSGHAANQKSGVNAITNTMIVINKLKSWLNIFSSKELGKSTLNIACVKGGIKIGNKDDEIILGKEGNIIPDYCEYVIEIRVASNNLNANMVKDFIEKESVNLGLKIINVKVRHNLRSWITAKEQLKTILELAPRKGFRKAKMGGYIDIQMLWEAFEKVPTFSFGAGEAEMSHKTDEYVKISSIVKAEKFLERILCK